MREELSAALPLPASMREAHPKRLLRSRVSQLAAASGGSLVVYIVGAGVSYLAQVATARLIGGTSFGVYVYVLAWTTLLANAATLGFHTSLLRLLPAYRAAQDWPRARGLVRFSAWGTALSGCIAAGVGVGTAVFVLGTHSEQAQTFLIGLWAIPIIALLLVVATSVRAWGGVVSALIPGHILRDALAVAVLGTVLAGGLLAPGAPAAAVALVAGTFGALAASYGLLRRRRPPELDTARAAFALGDWLRPTLPLTAFMLADVLMSRAGVLVLGSAGATREAGIFAVAYSLALLAALPRMAIASAFAPTVSDLHVRGERMRLQLLSARASRLSLMTTLLVAVPLVLAAKPLLSLFGAGFAAGAPAVVVLVLAQLFAAACGPQQHLLTMTGNERAAALTLAGAAGVNFICALLLVDAMGLFGVALASAGSLVAWNLSILSVAWRRLGLRPGLAVAMRNETSDEGASASRIGEAKP
ncbi:lipopolysaccharide biosynthesis protein [Siccirubricoccus sp. G192]|uniref:lipopolysaccharide biosynthesis protein n=1 Tax=Siccirubricoccus sp. G192 TaxID=2849651 RepID=UPI001C2C95CC|nr:oligosaccharide flippase family protein [Siccirubricoccus sp. G192]MBV1797541.1 oligosaccharide flippase family protein [Siccirubricoccus sp. G192]